MSSLDQKSHLEEDKSMNRADGAYTLSHTFFFNYCMFKVIDNLLLITLGLIKAAGFFTQRIYLLSYSCWGKKRFVFVSPVIPNLGGVLGSRVTDVYLV